MDDIIPCDILGKLHQVFATKIYMLIRLVNQDASNLRDKINHRTPDVILLYQVSFWN
jgi:hypothetical protein